MRVLLISANTEPFPEPVFPTGPVFIGNTLQKAGAKVRIIDMRHHSPASLRHELTAFRPDTIGISLRNMDNAAYPASRFYLPSYAALMRLIRASCDAPIILGGSAFSLFPEESLDRLGADAGVKGEGESTISIFWNPRHGSIAAGYPANLGDVGFPPNIDMMFPGFPRYRTFGIQTARGCPNRCIYCTYPCLEGRVRRHRSSETVAGEIDMLYRRFGARNFFIVDSLFNADEDHMVEVAEKISALNIRTRFSCYLQPKISDPGVFKLLRKAGCTAVDFGTDSGSQAILASLRKPFDRDDIMRASCACEDAGIDFCHSLLFGAPGETRETIHETIRLMDETSPKAVIAMTGIRIYPRTEIEHTAIAEGAIQKGASLLVPRFYFSPMGPSALLKHVHELAGGRKNWFFPGKRDWGSAIGFKVLGFLYRRGPLWKILRK